MTHHACHDLRLALRSGLVPVGESPDALVRAARQGEVAVLAAETVPALRESLAPAVQRQRRVDALLELGLARAARALGAAGLERVALLKGSAAAAWVYPETAWRMRRDLDLLVGEQLVEVRRALLGDGWADDVSPKYRPLGPERSRAWPMVVNLGQNKVSLDLHRTLVEPRDAWSHPSPDRILDEAVPGRSPLPVSSLRDTALHTVLHLANSGFHEPLKGWVDLWRLVPRVAPESLAERAREHGLRVATHACLAVVERWFGIATRAHREALDLPRWRSFPVEFLTSGEGETPERRPLPRGWSRRLWRTVLGDVPHLRSLLPTRPIEA